MKKTTTLIALLMGAPLILGACNDSNETDQRTATDESPLQEDHSTEDNVDEDVDNDTTDTGTPVEESEDQMDLVVGDTAVMHSNVSSFEFSLNSVEMVEEIDGEIPELDGYIIASITIENTGDEPIDAQETSRVFEYTSYLEGPGMPDDSAYYDEYEGVEGDIAPGEEMSGTAVYQGYIEEVNHLRVKPGLAGTSLVNDAVFTFTLDELEN